MAATTFVSWNGGWPRARDRIGDRRLVVLNWTGDISSSVFSRNTSNTGSLLRPGPERLPPSHGNSVLRLRFAIYTPFRSKLRPPLSIFESSMRRSLIPCIAISWNEKRDEKKGRGGERTTSKVGISAPAEYILWVTVGLNSWFNR